MSIENPLSPRQKAPDVDIALAIVLSDVGNSLYIGDFSEEKLKKLAGEIAKLAKETKKTETYKDDDVGQVKVCWISAEKGDGSNIVFIFRGHLRVPFTAPVSYEDFLKSPTDVMEKQIFDILKQCQGYYEMIKYNDLLDKEC